MEPIRPDSDEVAARKSEARKTAPRQPAAENAPVSGRQPPAGRSGAAKNSGRSSRPSALLVVVLVLIALGGGWLMFQQHQTIDQLQSNLGEAEDWINRSKLSMARFEGRLSEADRELLESGSQITEKLAFLDSEMRKLWGVANDRNRKAIEANQKATEFLEKKTDYLDKQRAEQRQLLTTQSEQLTAQAAQLKTVSQKAQGLEQQLAALTDRQQTLASTLDANTKAAEDYRTAQAKVQQQLNTISQRQTLSFDELRARVDAMEKRVASAGDEAAVKSLQGQLTSLKTVVESIDASRSQLTSRLLQLEERIQAASGG